MGINLEAVQLCITPETPLFAGQLHQKMRTIDVKPDRFFDSDWEIEEALSMEEAGLLDAGEIKPQEVDCFCSIGKILSCEGVTTEELDALDTEAQQVRHKFHPDFTGGYQAWASVIWPKHEAELRKYGINSESALRTIMQENDRYLGSENSTKTSVLNRAVHMLNWLRLMQDEF